MGDTLSSGTFLGETRDGGKECPPPAGKECPPPFGVISVMGGDWLSLVLIAGVFAVFLLLRRPGGG